MKPHLQWLGKHLRTRRSTQIQPRRVFDALTSFHALLTTLQRVDKVRV
jgi:hypothetical protein